MYIFLVYVNVVIIIYIQEGTTPVILAAERGHKDIVLILIQKGANLDLINAVSVHVHMLYNKTCITEDEMWLYFEEKEIWQISDYHNGNSFFIKLE